MAIKTGLGVARHRKCIHCPDKYFMQWPRFRHSVCSALGRDDEQLREQTATFYDDPTSTCPLGHWDNLVPVDREAEATESLERNRGQKTQKWSAIMDALFPEKLSAAEAQEKVDALVAAHLINDPVVAGNVKDGITKSVAEI